MIEIPDNPTRADAAAACEAMYQAVETFPFVSTADQSACLAAIMTGLSRRTMPAAPLIAINANTPASGKTLLANVVAAVATGRPASPMTVAKDPAELEKRVDAALLDADAFILLDNISFPIRSDALCVCATDSTKVIRVLGSSRSIRTPISSLFILTGNNLSLLGDLARRILMIRLDAGCERPELRTFARDAMQTIRDRRAELIAAALTVSVAYFRAGCPPARPDPEGRETVSPYGSFGDWDRMIRRPLIWAGMPDPLDAVGDLRQEDHEFIAMRDLLRAWHEIYDDAPVTAARAAQDAAEFIGGGLTPAARKAPALHDAMSAMGIDPRTGGSRELGYRLRAWQGRIIGGLRLDRDRKTMTGIAYAVRRIGMS
ncbi:MULTISPECIES: hypothetical protein [unclassified Thiocapsa]|uniref:hypothetical protein n=1 Tax=unclassified Thiocapsa TaxID=2641286 RepID=UPI0035B1F930